MSDELTLEMLRKAGISTNIGTDSRILPLVAVGIEDFAALEGVAGFDPDSRTFGASVGKGVEYVIALNHKHGDRIEVRFASANDGFFFPMTVAVTLSHEPNKPEDHWDGCPYACEVWPEDENGESYWVYDFDDDTPKNRHYEPECMCDYAEDSHKEFVVAEDADVAAIVAYIEENWR